MTEKEYLKIITELMHVGGYAIGYIRGIDHADNLTELKRNSIVLIEDLHLRLNKIADHINEKPNQ